MGKNVAETFVKKISQRQTVLFCKRTVNSTLVIYYRRMTRDHLEDPGVDGRILRWIFRTCDVGVWTGSSWLRIETGGGHL